MAFIPPASGLPDSHHRNAFGLITCLFVPLLWTAAFVSALEGETGNMIAFLFFGAVVGASCGLAWVGARPRGIKTAHLYLLTFATNTAIWIGIAFLTPWTMEGMPPVPALVSWLFALLLLSTRMYFGFKSRREQKKKSI